jgi:hypothetical protein
MILDFCSPRKLQFVTTPSILVTTSERKEARFKSITMTDKTKKLQSLLNAQVGKGGLRNIVAAVQSYDKSLG